MRAKLSSVVSGLVRGLALVAGLHLAVMPITAQADVASTMAKAFDEMGAAANITGPSAYQGQSAGYYSLGNVWVRMPQKTTNVANLQLAERTGRVRRHRHVQRLFFFHQLG